MVETSFPIRFGKYILLDRLASGGMAEVFRAKVTGAEDFQRLVAIKCMLPTLARDPQFATMFVDEAKLASQLSHANIVQIHELGKIDERLYIVMELINGHDLRHIIRTAKKKNLPIPFGFTAYVINRAAEGLDYAHSKTGMTGDPLNLIHRDISPQNILVSYDGGVKIVDFGIAKAEHRRTETNAGVLKGKFSYMAPEQVMGANLDKRSDIFALGIVLFELLTQKRLFHGKTDVAIMDRVRNAAVPKLVDVMPSAPPEFEDVIERALARNPTDRYANAMEMAEALQPILIETRSIFGGKQASEFMKVLYETELESLQQLFKRYATITWEECRETSGEHSPPEENLVFESDFDGAERRVLNGTPRADEMESTSDAIPKQHSRVQGFDPSYSSSRHRVVSRITPQLGRVDPTDSKDLAPLEIESIGSAAKMVLVSLVILTMVVIGAVVFVFSGKKPVTVQRTVVRDITPVISEDRKPASKDTGPQAVESGGADVAAKPRIRAESTRGGGVNPKEMPNIGQGSSGDESKQQAIVYGYLSVKSLLGSGKGEEGTRIKVYINDEDAGYSPITFYKVPVGEVSIRIEEQASKPPYRVKRLKETVRADHTRAKPKTVLIQF